MGDAREQAHCYASKVRRTILEENCSMPAISLPADVPKPLVDMALVAARLDASLAVFAPDDTIRFVSERFRQVYSFCDFSQPVSFDDLLMRTWEEGARAGGPVPKDPALQLLVAKTQRQGERLEFTRRYPVKFICSHLRVPSGWSAQLRVEPHHVGLEHYFADDAPVASVVDAIRRGEEARQRAAALDCLAIGVAVTGPDGVLRHRNAAMTDLLARRDGLEIDELNRLRARNPDDDASFRRIIAMAAAGRLPTGQAALCIRRSASGEPHTLSVSQGLAQLDGAAIIMVAPPKFDPAALAAVLHQDFDLSLAEARFAAAIGNGLTNEDASAEMGKSLNTGRSHLKAIFRKLDTKNIATGSQPRLARFVAVLGAISGAARTRGK